MTRKRSYSHILILIVFLLGSVALTIFVLSQKTAFPSRAQASSSLPPLVRGLPLDLWADKVLGKRDFGELSPREIVPYKLHSPAGVIVDRSVSPGRMYVWDSGNSRILGVDLSNCYSGSTACTADVVIGQPSGNDFGACNLDASFSNFPERKPASAETLCGIPESNYTSLEDKSYVSMDVDAEGNLYVPDVFNHRVLKYTKPFENGGAIVQATEVWGQPNYSQNGCNFTGGPYGGWNPDFPTPSPTSSSLCFGAQGLGAGVTLDKDGNLWVADGGNNRVVRFPKNSKTADLVIGQPNFSQGPFVAGTGLAQVNSPTAVRFDQAGNLYVADQHNNRVLIFEAPFTNGMPGRIFADNLNGPMGIDMIPEGVLVHEHYGSGLKIYGLDGQLIKTLPQISNGGGGIGVDAQGNFLNSSYQDPDVYRFTKDEGGNYQQTKRLFSPPYGFNLTSGRRLETPGWAGMAISGNQLIVADQRLLFWNNIPIVANGQPFDGFVGTSSVTEVPPLERDFSALATDSQNHLYVAKHIDDAYYSSVQIYATPLTTGATPIKEISTAPVLGGGNITFYNIRGLAATPDGKYLWVAEVDNHRVTRIRDPLSSPIVDVILGQKTVGDRQLCNRGEVPQPNSGTSEVADLTMLCFPGGIELDNNGNLFVSDHFIESSGNWRMLMFKPLSTTLQSVLFAPPADKEFPAKMSPNPTNMTFKPAFNSDNIMVVGFNPYSSNRFVNFFLDPTKINPNNPRDPNFAHPDGQLNDFYNWPVASSFDANDNLYVYDTNRSQVRLYYQPFAPKPVQTIITAQVKSSWDDVNQDGKTLTRNYSYGPTSKTLWVGTGENVNNSYTGIRFTEVSIPLKAKIISARLEFYTSTTQSRRVSVDIRAEAADNSAPFSFTSYPSLRALTTNKLSSNTQVSTPGNNWIGFQNLAPVIQEVVNRPNWKSSNALSLILKGSSNKNDRKFATSFDGNVQLAPKLTIQYEISP